MYKFVAVALAAIVLSGAGVTTGAGAAPPESPTGSRADGGTWVPVFSWAGGGEGNDMRDSASFALKGGQQRFDYSAVVLTGPDADPMLGWTVESVDDSGESEMIDPPGTGSSETYMYLPGGDYYVSSDTLDCTWSIAVSELRSDTVVPALTLRLGGTTSGAMKLGGRVTAKGTATPTSLASSTVRITVQKAMYGSWGGTRTAKSTVGASGAYGWTFKPAVKGLFRLQATMAKTRAHVAATTPWRKFKVK